MFEAPPPPQYNPVDVYVGSRIRLRRRSLGVSQDGLAKQLDLSFQQVQKYERGANRISASKLYEAGRALKVPVAYFFNGYDGTVEDDLISETSVEQRIHNFLRTLEGIELAEAFPRVKTAKLRRRILDLVRALGDED